MTDETVAVVAKALRSGEPVALLLGGAAVREPRLRAASRIAAATGAKVLGETFPDPPRARRRAPAPRPARLPRRVRGRPARGHPPPGARRREGAGVVLRLPGQAELARPRRLRGARPRDRSRTTRSTRSSGSPTPSAPRDTEPLLQAAGRPDRPTGPITGATIADALGALLPEGRDRRRRGPDRRAVGRGRDRGRAAPRLAHAHRRRDRHGHAARHRRGDRVPGPAGDQPRGRRQRDVHAAVAVDPGPRGPRRDDDHLRQPLLRDPQPRAEPGRRRGARARRR